MNWTSTTRHVKNVSSISVRRLEKALLSTRVSDPHWFTADPDEDLDPAFFLIANPDPGSGSRVWWPKIEKIYSWKLIFIFLIKNCHLLILGLHKGRPATDAFSPQKTTSSTSKHENSVLFSIFVGHFCPPGSGSGSNLNADPDPATQINADPCRSGSETLLSTE
jgi:hypothetical protein